MPERDVLRIPATATVRFVGDVHLGDGGRSDLFRGKDALLIKHLKQWAGESDAIVFMGDLFDLPQAMSTKRILRSHHGVIEAVRQLCGQTRVVIIRGNHDWRVNYAPIFPSATTCERMELGDFLVWHGHNLDSGADVESSGYFGAMVAHAMFERILRFDFRVPLHDFNTPQNRAMHWIGYHFSRVLARRGRADDFIKYWSREVWGDPRAMFEPVRSYLADSRYAGMICGHTHLPGAVDLGDRIYVNAGSWAFAAANVATWNGARFEIKDLATGQDIDDEHYRWMLAQTDPGSFFDWWDAHYLGRLKFRPAISPLEAGSANA